MRIILLLIILSTINSITFASGHRWIRSDANLKNINRIVIFPVEGERSFGGAEGYFQDKLQEGNKKKGFILLKPANRAESALLADDEKAQRLVNTHFATETERAKAVDEAYAADAYIVCKVRENRIQEDWSPETTTSVTLTNYTEDYGGRDGYKKTTNRTWTENYTIPGGYVQMHIITLDFYMYDYKGEKLMLFNDTTRSYSYDAEVDLFRNAAKSFNKEFKKAAKVK